MQEHKKTHKHEDLISGWMPASWLNGQMPRPKKSKVVVQAQTCKPSSEREPVRSQSITDGGCCLICGMKLVDGLRASQGLSPKPDTGTSLQELRKIFSEDSGNITYGSIRHLFDLHELVRDNEQRFCATIVQIAAKEAKRVKKEGLPEGQEELLLMFINLYAFGELREEPIRAALNQQAGG